VDNDLTANDKKRERGRGREAMKERLGFGDQKEREKGRGRNLET
jgi:hypothetical protein